MELKNNDQVSTIIDRMRDLQTIQNLLSRVLTLEEQVKPKDEEVARLKQNSSIQGHRVLLQNR